MLAVLTAAALDTAAAINTNENTVGAATVCSQSDTGLFGGLPMPRGGVTQMSTFHSPLPSFQVRIPLQLEEPRKYRKGRRQVPKHRCLLPFYTLDLYASPPLMSCLSHVALIRLHQAPATCHLSCFHSMSSLSVKMASWCTSSGVHQYSPCLCVSKPFHFMACLPRVITQMTNRGHG